MMATGKVIFAAVDGSKGCKFPLWEDGKVRVADVLAAFDASSVEFVDDEDGMLSFLTPDARGLSTDSFIAGATVEIQVKPSAKLSDFERGAKRPRQDDFQRRKKEKLDDDRRENLNVQLQNFKSLRNQLKDQFCNEDGHCTPDFLWDVSLVLTLSHACTGATYSYMGRHVAEALYKKVTALVRTEDLTIVGAKGSGKSTIAETLAYYLIISGKPAVYFSAKSFLKNRFVVMLQGLLLAVEQEESALNKLRNWDDIIQWCGTFKNTIYFFVDDWDAFETKEDVAAMYEAIYVHAVICITSTNSDLRIKKLQSDKDREKLQIIDGPYTEEELKIWVSQSSLKVTDECDFWVHLDYWTGGMPRLLKLYEEANGIPETFIQFIDQSHIQKLLSDFINLAKTSQELMQCLKFVTEGELSGALPHRKGKKVADLTCFYQDKGLRWHILCPFLKVKAEAIIVERLSISHIEFGLQSFERWKEVVVADCQTDHVNRARVGWNVESLVLNVLKCRRYVFKDLLPYSRYVEYLPMKCDAIVRSLEESGIRKGVLLIPKKYYEKAIDCVYIHWADDKYTVAGIQISVGGWKAKERKESHLQWNGDVWVHEGVKKGAKQPVVEKKYYYVMPMAANSSGGFEWKKFSDISPLLSFLDAIALKEPVNKEPLKQCEGTTKNDKRCGRWIKDSHCSQHKKGEET